MGSCIATDLLLRGQSVVALSPVDSPVDASAPRRIAHQLQQCYEHGMADQPAETYLSKIQFTQDYHALKPCGLVIENVIEQLSAKRAVFEKIEAVVSAEAIITTNTSATPISLLQQSIRRPGRFLGLHWAEPAYTTRFLEIICGEQSDLAVAQVLYATAERWGKEPTLVRRDIRGFITNRLMYSLYREALYLVENGYATMEDVDRTCRNDAGHWLTFCGPFRYMDLTGLQAYYHVMQDLLPTLSSQTTTPDLIAGIAREGGNGTSNGRGFYAYTEEEAREWEQRFEEFSFDIAKLAARYRTQLAPEPGE